MNEEMRNMLAEYLSRRAEMTGGAAVAPPQGAGPQGPNLPEMALRSRGNTARPAVSGGYEMPVGEGELSLRGDLYKPNPQARPEWGAQIGYHRKF